MIGEESQSWAVPGCCLSGCHFGTKRDTGANDAVPLHLRLAAPRVVTGVHLSDMCGVGTFALIGIVAELERIIAALITAQRRICRAEVQAPLERRSSTGGPSGRPPPRDPSRASPPAPERTYGIRAPSAQDAGTPCRNHCASRAPPFPEVALLYPGLCDSVRDSRIRTRPARSDPDPAGAHRICIYGAVSPSDRVCPVARRRQESQNARARAPPPAAYCPIRNIRL